MVDQDGDKIQSLLRVRSQPNYQEMKQSITNDISFESRSTLIVWCPENLAPHQYVSAMLKQYGKTKRFLQRWFREDNASGRGMWGGALIQYVNPDVASFVEKNFPMICRHVKILSLIDVLNLLMDCELKHHPKSKHLYKVNITGTGIMADEHLSSLFFQLYSYGKIESLFINNQLLATHVDGHVAYPFLAQAYLAATMTDGVTYGHTVLSAKLEETPEHQEILNDVKNYIVMAMDRHLPK